MEGVYIYEFLFRGGESSKPDDDTWHVILARNVTDLEGRPKVETTTALSPARAAELGFTLDRILTDLNAKAVTDVVQLREAHSAKETELSAKTEELEAAKAELEDIKRTAPSFFAQRLGV